MTLVPPRCKSVHTGAADARRCGCRWRVERMRRPMCAWLWGRSHPSSHLGPQAVQDAEWCTHTTRGMLTPQHRHSRINMRMQPLG